MTKSELVQSMPLILKSTDLVNTERYARCMLYGERGVGKTTMLETLPKPLLIISYEGGSEFKLINKEGIDIAPINSRKSLQELLNYLKDFNEYKSIAFDSISAYVKQILNEILFDNNKVSPSQEHWRILSSFITNIITSLFSLSSHIVLTALEKREYDAKDYKKEIKRRPDLPVITNGLIRNKVDIQGYMYETADDNKERKVAFSSNKTITELKDISGNLTKLETPDFSQIFKKMFGGEIQ